MTAAELMAQLDGDPEFQREKRAREIETEQRARSLREAEQPIVKDLHRRGGVDVASVWDLVNTPEPYPDALPILLEHLERGGYPDRVMESLGRAMAVKPAAFAWGALLALYLRAEGHGEMEGLAVALAASATPQHLDSMISLLGDDSRGDTRIHLLRAINRVGDVRGTEVLESLRGDAVFGKEATALLKKRG